RLRKREIGYTIPVQLARGQRARRNIGNAHRPLKGSVAVAQQNQDAARKPLSIIRRHAGDRNHQIQLAVHVEIGGCQIGRNLITITILSTQHNTSSRLEGAVAISKENGNRAGGAASPYVQDRKVGFSVPTEIVGNYSRRVVANAIAHGRLE